MARAFKRFVQPHPARATLAFLVAPIASAFVFTLALSIASDKEVSVNEFFVTVFFMLLIAVPITVYIALPLYFLLRHRIEPRLFHMAAVGAFAGIAPFIILFLLRLSDNLSGVSEDLLPTREIPSIAKLLTMAAASGSCGGFAFWICAVWHDPRFEKQEAI